jgi:HTH-type transcriptional regulator/antitoxin HigA
LGPIKEMQRRGWIRPTDDPEALEREVLSFFGISDINDKPDVAVSMRMSSSDEELSPAQRAWCYRVRRLASALKVSPFSAANLPQCAAGLRKLAAYPQEARKVPSLLASYGIRLVVVEPLAGSKVDGVATWLDEASPAIGLSLRFDRVDAFWHTLAHEFSHILHRDAAPVDTDLVGPDQKPPGMKSPIERRADEEAAALLVPPDKLESFIVRVGPMYSKARIVQFAHQIKMHPGIIVGQLQFRGEIGYHANREMLAKVRDILVSASVTDGWGHTIDERGLS